MNQRVGLSPIPDPWPPIPVRMSKARVSEEVRMTVSVMRSLAVGVAILAIGCGGGGASESRQPTSTGSAPTANNSGASLDKGAYPVFPDADQGADPAVSAEQGGKGFTGAGWETNTDFDLIGDPRAVKGGAIREYIADFPSSLRMVGPGSNSDANFMIGNCLYETLLMLHPTTLGYIPSLATHWQISEDKMTYRFRINPNARFSNGEPVTADDVVASWVLSTDKTVQDPSRNAQFGKFEKPVAES